MPHDIEDAKQSGQALVRCAGLPDTVSVPVAALDTRSSYKSFDSNKQKHLQPD